MGGNRSSVRQHRTMTARTISILEKLRTMTTRTVVECLESWPWNVRQPRRVADKHFLLQITTLGEWHPHKHSEILTLRSVRQSRCVADERLLLLMTIFGEWYPERVSLTRQVKQKEQ